MEAFELQVALMRDWTSRQASRDFVLAEAEQFEEAISMAVDEYLSETEALMGGDTEPWDA